MSVSKNKNHAASRLAAVETAFIGTSAFPANRPVDPTQTKESMNLLPKILRQTDGTNKATSASPLESQITAVRDMKARLDAFISRKDILERQAADHVVAVDLSEAACTSFSVVNAGITLAAATDKAFRETANLLLNTVRTDVSRAGDRVRQTHFDIDAAIRDLVIASLPPELAGIEVVAKESYAVGVFAQNVGSKNISTLHISATKWGKAETAVRFDPIGASISGWENTAGIDSIAPLIGEWIPQLERLAKEEERSISALADLRGQLRKAA